MSVYHLGLLCLCFILNHWTPGSRAWPCGYSDENCPIEGARAPNPADCTQYYWCVHGKWRLLNCSGLSSDRCGTAPAPYCRRVTCPEITSPTIANPTTEVITIKITPRSVSASSRPITTSYTDITTSGLMSDTAAVTTMEPTSTSPSGNKSVPELSLTPGAVASTVTSVALALLNIIQCVLLVILWRRIKRTERSDQSIQPVSKEEQRTTDLTSNGHPMENPAASRCYGDNYMFLVKSEYIDGSAISEANGDRNGYQELHAAETPSNDEYSYAYASAGGRKASVKPGEQNKKHKSDVYELQLMYSNELQ